MELSSQTSPTLLWGTSTHTLTFGGVFWASLRWGRQKSKKHVQFSRGLWEMVGHTWQQQKVPLPPCGWGKAKHNNCAQRSRIALLKVQQLLEEGAAWELCFASDVAQGAQQDDSSKAGVLSLLGTRGPRGFDSTNVNVHSPQPQEFEGSL